MSAGARLHNAFQLLSAELLPNGVAQTGVFTSDELDKMTYNTATIQIKATANAKTATAKIEGSLNGSDWFNVPYRTPSSDTSANTDLTINADGTYVYYIDPKYVRYLRVDVTANTGVSFNSILAAAVF